MFMNHTLSMSYPLNQTIFVMIRYSETVINKCNFKIMFDDEVFCNYSCLSVGKLKCNTVSTVKDNKYKYPHEQ